MQQASHTLLGAHTYQVDLQQGLPNRCSQWCEDPKTKSGKKSHFFYNPRCPDEGGQDLTRLVTSSPLDEYELDPESLHETMAALLLGGCGGLDGGDELRRRAEEQSKKQRGE